MAAEFDQDLRHTFASLLVQNRESLASMKDQNRLQFDEDDRDARGRHSEL